MRTLLISLGGHSYPNSPGLRHRAFEPSSRAVAAMLTRPDVGLVAAGDHLDLFDDDRSWPDQVIAIRDWLRDMVAPSAGHPGPQDRLGNVIVHYVGHGAFRRNSDEHVLTINRTDAVERTTTSALLGQLNDALVNTAGYLRRYYIIDACFAAASVRDLMPADAEEMIEVRVGALLQAWPQGGCGTSGVAALCSADRISTADAGGERDLTQFTDGLLTVMEVGDADVDHALTLRRAHQLLRVILIRRYRDHAVHPVLVAPEDAGGGIAAVPLLPNLAKRIPPALLNDLAPETQSLAPMPIVIDPDPVAKRPVSTFDSRPTDGSDLIEEATLTEDQRFRQAVYRFFRLPPSQKHYILARLCLGEAGDESMPELGRFKAVLARVRDRNAVEMLERMVGQAESSK